MLQKIFVRTSQTRKPPWSVLVTPDSCRVAGRIRRSGPRRENPISRRGGSLLSRAVRAVAGGRVGGGETPVSRRTPRPSSLRSEGTRGSPEIDKTVSGTLVCKGGTVEGRFTRVRSLRVSGRLGVKRGHFILRVKVGTGRVLPTPTVPFGKGTDRVPDRVSSTSQL